MFWAIDWHRLPAAGFVFKRALFGASGIARVLERGQPEHSSPEQICLAVGGNWPVRSIGMGKSALRWFF
jgi:hypothetical protein